MNKVSVDEILDFAIIGEEASSKFYLTLASKMGTKAMRQVFEDFAKEELNHKAKLEKMKREGLVALRPTEQVPDLKIADYVVDVEPKPDMSYRDAIILAMKREKSAFRLYSDLAANVLDSACRDLFLTLAQEEAKHKLRFEIEYDEHVMQED